MSTQSCLVTPPVIHLNSICHQRFFKDMSPLWQLEPPRCIRVDRARPCHYTKDMDVSRVDLPSVCKWAAKEALTVVRIWWSKAAYANPMASNILEPFGDPILHMNELRPHVVHA